ncbi:RING finger protein 112-like isoform X10 [Mauremys mutica]|uniref:RING finger protein 112-like isoform X10 n=1 Tax=Mauremys mutica TaxID=74926 RepID=UPI001D16B65A|nr:RING finger protein 112-like isoform X10 [Mauremys mutica]
MKGLCTLQSLSLAFPAWPHLSRPLCAPLPHAHCLPPPRTINVRAGLLHPPSNPASRAAVRTPAARKGHTWVRAQPSSSRALLLRVPGPDPQGPGAQPEPGRPVQLVRLDEEGGLTLDEEALSRCLEQGGVGDAPVCLVSIIGEQRRGKSFLMNCLLRRLQSPEAADASWMGQEDQALGGFECRNGMATVTRGVWMWDQPLWVQAQGRRVAVFLVDTEGSLDLKRRLETSIKLSVFSILLSSCWIFNISSTFKQTEADYLEMFIQVAKEVGGTCNLAPIQHLDLLVRDWQLSGAYGANGGQEYLRDITRDLEASAEQPLVLEALGARSTQCYLLPHPGTGFTRSRAGTPGDMDTIFQQYLCDYVTTVVRSAGTHVRTDRAGQSLTGAQLAARIKGVSRYLKTQRYDFSSPMKMAEAFAAMREEVNRKAVEATRREYEQFVQELDCDHQSMSSCLRVKPLEMQQRLEGKRQELLEQGQGELWGKDPQKQAALEELKKELDKQIATFLPRYEQRFKMAEMAEMREKANRGAVEAASREYGLFVQRLDRDHQSMSSCLRMKPLEMKRRQEMKHRVILKRYQGELRGEDPQKQAALEELKKELDKQMATFLPRYEQRFKVKKAKWLGLYIGQGVSWQRWMAAMEANKKAVEVAMKGYEHFVQKLQDRDHQSMSSCLRVKPAEMQQRLEVKCQELLERCWRELWNEDPQKQAALKGLKQELSSQMAQFLRAYKERFKEKQYKRWGMRILEGAVVVAGGSIGGRIGLSVAAAMVAGAERFMGLD